MSSIRPKRRSRVEVDEDEVIFEPARSATPATLERQMLFFL